MLSVSEHQTPVLIVDDDIGLLLSIKTMLVNTGMPEPALVSDSRKVIGLVRKNRFRLILMNLGMPHLGGMDLLKMIKREFPHIECIMAAAADEVPHAVQSIKFGAYDYLVKPLDNDKLTILISRALERFNLRRELYLYKKKPSFADLSNPEAFQDLVAEDEAMALVFHQVETVAGTDYPVVITGESGTGKKRIAAIIHCLSRRAERPFMAVNLATGCKTLFEDEYFGHDQGAYTGDVKAKKAFFEAAQGGTLFLDEITDLHPELQGKLLRVIEEGEQYRLGSAEIKNVDVRILAATNRDIEEEIHKERFRADLFYRLNVCHIHIPPLRERHKDILCLARHFLQMHCIKNNQEVKTISPELGLRLKDYPFPGNVRELEHVMASAILSEKSPVLTLASVAKTLRPALPAAPKTPSLYPLSEIEKQHILQVLAAANGNRTQAAKILGIGLRTLQRRLKEVGITSPVHKGRTPRAN